MGRHRPFAVMVVVPLFPFSLRRADPAISGDFLPQVIQSLAPGLHPAPGRISIIDHYQEGSARPEKSRAFSDCSAHVAGMVKATDRNNAIETGLGKRRGQKAALLGP